jgi:hypothetical protein
MDHSYAEQKLTLLLRDLSQYSADEFRRQMARIISGATGQDIPDDCHQTKAERNALAKEVDEANDRIGVLTEERDALSAVLVEVKKSGGTGQSPCAKFCESVALRKDFDLLREHSDKMKVERDEFEASNMAWNNAFDALFVHCCSNGVFNAWGQPFNCTSLNNARMKTTKLRQGGE